MSDYSSGEFVIKVESFEECDFNQNEEKGQIFKYEDPLRICQEGTKKQMFLLKGGSVLEKTSNSTPQTGDVTAPTVHSVSEGQETPCAAANRYSVYPYEVNSAETQRKWLKQPPKTSAERMREFRARKKLLKQKMIELYGHHPSTVKQKVVKSGAERMRDFRARKKLCLMKLKERVGQMEQESVEEEKFAAAHDILQGGENSQQQELHYDGRVKTELYGLEELLCDTRWPSFEKTTSFKTTGNSVVSSSNEIPTERHPFVGTQSDPLRLSPSEEGINFCEVRIHERPNESGSSRHHSLSVRSDLFTDHNDSSYPGASVGTTNTSHKTHRKRSHEPEREPDEDSDYHFALSLVAYMKKVPEQDKLKMRIELLRTMHLLVQEMSAAKTGNRTSVHEGSGSD